MESFNTFVTCPFDNTHKMLKGRLSTHLARCSRNSGKSVGFVVCPLNDNHRVVPSELQDHIKVCKNRSTLEKFRTVDKHPPPAAAPPSGATERPCLVECKENWDDEPDVATYNPQVYCKQNLIVKSIAGQGLPKAERKMIRDQERQRFKDLTNSQKN